MSREHWTGILHLIHCAAVVIGGSLGVWVVKIVYDCSVYHITVTWTHSHRYL